MKRAALYVRVSTQEQKLHGLSIDSQIMALQDYCKQNNYIVAGIYNDAGISARKTYKKRPGLLKLIDDCQNNKIDIVLFTKLDRFFRSVSDYYACVDQMNNIPWKCIWEDYETETSSGIFKVNIMLSVAQSEADRTSERIKSTIDYRKKKGYYVGSAPTGYKIENKHLVKDPEKEPIINLIFKTYLKTKSITQCVTAVKNTFNITIQYFVIRKFIRNPAYMGKCSNGYECEPYITPEEFQFVCDNIGKNAPRQTKFPKRVYYFSGLCTCKECGHRIVGRGTSRMSYGQRIAVKNYYCEYSTKSSVHDSLFIAEAKLENYLLNSIDMLHDMQSKEIIEQNARALNNKSTAATISKLQSKLKRLAVLFEDDDISELDYKMKRDALKLELSQLTVQPQKELTPLPSNWKSIYNSLDEDHKRDFWHSIIKEIFISNKNKKCPDVVFK